MGALMSSAMDKQQEFMAKNGKLQMERQMEMQNFMRERMMAAQVAGTRELLNWTGSFAAIVTTGLVAGAAKSGNKKLLAPLLPIGFIIGYQYDMAYGTKVERITVMTEDLLRSNKSKFRLPLGPITFDDIELAREQTRLAAEASKHVLDLD